MMVTAVWIFPLFLMRLLGSRLLLRVSSAWWLLFLISLNGHAATDSCVVRPFIQGVQITPRRTVEPLKVKVGEQVMVIPIGHPNGQQPDDAFFFDGVSWSFREAVLPWQKDRHACVPLDFNTDGLDDLYCVAGGGRGEGVGNPNRAYLGSVSGEFMPIVNQPEPSLASLRSRGVYSLDTPLVQKQRLLLTVWGERKDSRLNETIVATVDTERVVIEQILPGRSGGRCAAVSDLNHDGFDDFALCHEQGGASLWISGPDGQYHAQPLEEERWITDVAFGSAKGDVTPLYVLGLDRLDRIDVACRAETCTSTAMIHQLATDDGGRAASLVVGDFAASPDEDVLIIRRSGEQDASDREDFLLLGPNLTVVWPVPGADQGQGYKGLEHAGGVIRFSGGPDSRGLPDVIHCDRTTTDRG